MIKYSSFKCYGIRMKSSIVLVKYISLQAWKLVYIYKLSQENCDKFFLQTGDLNKSESITYNKKKCYRAFKSVYKLADRDTSETNHWLRPHVSSHPNKQGLAEETKIPPVSKGNLITLKSLQFEVETLGAHLIPWNGWY